MLPHAPADAACPSRASHEIIERDHPNLPPPAAEHVVVLKHPCSVHVITILPSTRPCYALQVTASARRSVHSQSDALGALSGSPSPPY
jgi:hypothetical protein